MVDLAKLKERIASALPGAEIELTDMTGTSDHFEARIVSDRFAGKSLVDQHQLVYSGLDDWLKTGELHALSLRTFTPEQWARFLERKAKK